MNINNIPTEEDWKLAKQYTEKAKIQQEAEKSFPKINQQPFLPNDYISSSLKPDEEMTEIKNSINSVPKLLTNGNVLNTRLQIATLIIASLTLIVTIFK